MDNFTHSLVGWAIGQTGLKSKTRKGLAALVLGANLPDIDVFFGWMPWAPLATHRGFTHSLIGGVLLLPPLLAGLLWLIDRWQLQRGARFASGLSMNVRWLLGLSYLGALTHPLLDLQTSYAVQLFAPFSNRWFHTESLFIIDVWIWTALALGIWLSRRRERQGGDWRQPAVAALAAVCAYIGVNNGISLVAKHDLVADVLHATPQVLIAGEEPVLFWRRDLVWRQGGRIGRASYDPLRHPGRITDIAPEIPDNMANPLVRRAMDVNPGIIAFMRWSILPTAQVEHERCAARVLIGDARFGNSQFASRFLHSATLPAGGAGCRRAHHRGR